MRREFKPAKEAYSRSQATGNPGAYGPDDLARMNAGKPPIGGDGFPLEIHHRTPLARGGTNDVDNFEVLTRTEHRLGPNYKRNHPGLP